MAFRLSVDARARRIGRPRSGLHAVVASLILMVLLAPTAGAAGKSPLDGTSSSTAEEDAKRAIPWKDLTTQDRRIAQYVTRDCSVYRRMPTRVIRCQPEVFNFLTQRPEVVAGVWNVMGISKLELVRNSPHTFRATDNAGTEGAIRVLHADWGADARNRVVVYAEGVYEAKPLPRPIKARSILVLRSASIQREDGETYVTARLDSFVRFERATEDFVARTLRPLLNRTADHNFVETMNFVSTFSQTAERNPDGLARLSERLEKVDEKTQTELAALCHRAAENRERSGRELDLARSQQ